jgi:hypothetical protein
MLTFPSAGYGYDALEQNRPNDITRIVTDPYGRYLTGRALRRAALLASWHDLGDAIGAVVEYRADGGPADVDGGESGAIAIEIEARQDVDPAMRFYGDGDAAVIGRRY